MSFSKTSETNQFQELRSVGLGTHKFNYPPINVEIIGKVGLSSVAGKTYEAIVQPIVRGEITSVNLTNKGVGYGASEVINFNRTPDVSLNSGRDAVITPVVANGKIVDVNYNFFDFDLTQSKTIVFDKKKFKERVIITITTENIPDGTRIDFQINPKTSMGITVGSGTISNNVCSIVMENDFMVNMTSQKQINYFYFKVGTNIKFKNTYPWMDYVVAK